MIVSAFIDLAYYLIANLIEYLPAGGGFPAGVHTAAMTLGGYAGALDLIFPISTLATVVALVFSIEMGLWGFRALRWIITHIPYIGGY